MTVPFCSDIRKACIIMPLRVHYERFLLSSVKLSVLCGGPFRVVGQQIVWRREIFSHSLEIHKGSAPAGGTEPLRYDIVIELLVFRCGQLRSTG